jgi:hypothetical protein
MSTKLKVFQAYMKANRSAAAIPGAANGKATCRNVPHQLQPSTFAASSTVRTASGICSKELRTIQTTNGKVISR